MLEIYTGLYICDDDYEDEDEDDEGDYYNDDTYSVMVRVCPTI